MERPILFSGPMVRAILEGRKTQTRRVMKPEPKPIPTDGSIAGEVYTSGWFDGSPAPDYVIKQCPYGQPGDRLWVRETFDVGRPWRNGDGIIEDEIIWDGRLPSEDPRGKLLFDDWCVGYRADGCESDRWRPSIHMPRWASRLTLELTDVRAQKLQEISEEDAKAEGVASFRTVGPDTHGWYPEGFVANFKLIWDFINSRRGYGWDVNPYVWALTFKVVK